MSFFFLFLLLFLSFIPWKRADALFGVFSMKRSGVSPDDVALKQGVSPELMWEWESKGTRLLMVCSAGESILGTFISFVYTYVL